MAKAATRVWQPISPATKTELLRYKICRDKGHPAHIMGVLTGSFRFFLINFLFPKSAPSIISGFSSPKEGAFLYQ